MILKPRLEDVKLIGFYLSKIILALGASMALPLAVSLALAEFSPAADFAIGIEIALICGLAMQRVCRTDRDLRWMHGMIVVSLSWVAAMFLAAVPLYLSGHWASFLDACFDTMSGFATTGLALAQDLDHMSYGHNFWRHLIMFIGGQGIVIVALSFFVKGLSGAFKMYVGEARDEKILPNVIQSSRFIWLVSFVFLVIGTAVLGIAGMLNGMRPFNAFFHGICIFITAFDTGGFAPHSQSILYYHSAAYEIITVVIMIMGAINFKLHYHLWTGRRREILSNIESRTFFISVFIVFFIVAAGLRAAGMYPQAGVLFRKGFYQLISGHTGTGFQTIYPGQFLSDWNDLAVVGIIIAMAFGGAVCSTTGAIKMVRLGVISKAFIQDVKRILLPERAVVQQKFHHIREVFLDDKIVRTALIITFAYIVLYGLGSLVGMLYGYPFLKSLFESTSAAANVGLSCGITAPAMPAGLKVTYIVQMWAGRLEFMSVLTLLGFLVAAVKGKR
ncbi:MAG: TrkH family potassium uptake protein [Candidatus Omnitrophica bacterium]|nr:TrkH family potassium uptake protein [Candidatus Omnitrophota bacterium]MDD4940978.1 TrkH family potassium uptake protein [Candidatus Omnitrophota bacterium]MDD5775077.1 TrkH family potassium uptake protein [Candidatus Omnitrophota bacterium]HNQ49980.1 TrkH family potassium uptake protein [Candidatus Omnitrophota bacterium]HQO37372.1 TrkH family potassium uptake protein [Candidatus Omnitrophota bacterium]